MCRFEADLNGMKYAECDTYIAVSADRTLFAQSWHLDLALLMFLHALYIPSHVSVSENSLHTLIRPYTVSLRIQHTVLTMHGP